MIQVPSSLSLRERAGVRGNAVKDFFVKLGYPEK
jgi:hypothetical protein